MALRLRRGTDAERQLITPVEGELIYTTDTKLLYVGDGSTAGGTLVTGAGGGSSTLDALTDTDLTGAANNDVLTFVSATNKWEAVAVPGVGTIGLNDLDDVDTTGLLSGDLLQFDGVRFVPKTLDEVFLPDGTLSGAFLGTLDGDMNGSVFADDSTLIVDGVTGNVSANVLSVGNGGILVTKTGNSLDVYSFLQNGRIDDVTFRTNLFALKGDLAEGEGATFSTSTSRGTIAAPTGLQAGDFAGSIQFSAYKTSLSDYRSNAGIIASIDTVSGTDDIPSKLSVFLRDPDGTPFFPLTINSKGVTESSVFKATPFDDTTARDAAITSPEAGMVIYLTSTNKLQCYNGTTWNDLF